MTTKKLLLTAVLGAAVSTSAIAQNEVYSQNVVGYVNVSLTPGFTMLSNPLKNGNNSLDVILPNAPDGMLLYKFSGGTFQDANEFFAGFGWVQAGVASTTTLAPGEGAFVSVSAPVTLTFVGEVSQHADSNTTVPSGFSMVGSAVPQSGVLSALGFPAADGDLVYTFNPQSQTYNDAYEFFAGFGWVQAGTAAEPTVGVGESFFSFKSAQANWTRDFSVN